MPDVASERCQLDFEDVANKRADSVCGRDQLLRSNFDCALRDIEDAVTNVFVHGIDRIDVVHVQLFGQLVGIDPITFAAIFEQCRGALL